jgi:hypothetical protein
VRVRETPGLISQLLHLVEQPAQHLVCALILQAELVECPPQTC